VPGRETAASERELRISKRQREILELAATGLTDKQVAQRLSISVSTVRTHLERFYRDNGVRNKTAAVGLYLRLLEGERRS
jgi:DNA-binding CsgD family transcriptional regulator